MENVVHWPAAGLLALNSATSRIHHLRHPTCAKVEHLPRPDLQRLDYASIGSTTGLG